MTTTYDIKATLSTNITDADMASMVPVDMLQPRITQDKPLIVIVECGSFSPITNMHLQMFSNVRSYINKVSKEAEVVGGLISPVHDMYGKSSLIPQCHRLRMCQLALQEGILDWVGCSTFETSQSKWTRTRDVLQCYQDYLNKCPRKQALYGATPLGVRLMCGADLVESFEDRNVWLLEDVHHMLGHMGVCAVSRAGFDLAAMIEKSDLLRPYKHKIHIVEPFVVNNISSTVIRKLLKDDLSVDYLIPRPVEQHIKKYGLYDYAKWLSTAQRDALSGRTCCTDCSCNNCQVQPVVKATAEKK